MILSACNTAAGQALNAEALSGLANSSRANMGSAGDAMRAIQSGCLSTIAPTNLILDSRWSLILSEILLRRFSSHAGKYARTSLGKIPSRGVALVIDYIEANLDQDLRSAALAKVSAMSTYHFARRFKETVDVSPTPMLWCGAFAGRRKC